MSSYNYYLKIEYFQGNCLNSSMPASQMPNYLINSKVNWRKYYLMKLLNFNTRSNGPSSSAFHIFSFGNISINSSHSCFKFYSGSYNLYTELTLLLRNVNLDIKQMI